MEPPFKALFWQAHWHLGLQLHFSAGVLVQLQSGPHMPLQLDILRLDLDLFLSPFFPLVPPNFIIVCGSTLYKLFVKKLRPLSTPSTPGHCDIKGPQALPTNGAGTGAKLVL
jgi:hypothetical protein